MKNNYNLINFFNKNDMYINYRFELDLHDFNNPLTKLIINLYS